LLGTDSASVTRETWPAAPAVSVLLPVRDEEGRIGRAIESILAQTLSDWELLVVDDGSTDGTVAVAESFGDPRIRVLRCERLGLTPALNYGLTEARGPFVARQDADDYSFPERLATQYAFLQAHSDVAVVGSAWVEEDSRNQRVKPRVQFVAGRLNETLPRFNPIAHSAAMFRTNVIRSMGGYDERRLFAQDYDLWLRVASSGQTLWNLPVTHLARVHTRDNIGTRHDVELRVEELAIRYVALRDYRSGALPPGLMAWHLARRTATVLFPTAIRRIVRRVRGQAP
jgi:glycosyltransferase involved in cell wall biosynthesis